MFEALYMLYMLISSGVDKLVRTLPSTSTDLRGRTVIVTGSNVGLGLEAARKFYAMNPSRLILAVRSLEKGEAAKKSILDRSGEGGRSETKVEVWELDLADFANVKAFAERCEKELDRIDILLENAAASNDRWAATKDGWETMLQTNVLSTYLLAALLAPLLAKTAKLSPPPGTKSTFKPHLVIVASDAYQFAAFRARRSTSSILAAMNDKSTYSAFERYPDTKIIEILLAPQFAKAYTPFANGDVVLATVNPGFCRSELMRTVPGAVREVMYTLFARSTEEGANSYTWTALKNDIPPGSYTSTCTIEAVQGIAADQDSDDLRARLWKEVSEFIVREAPQTASTLGVTPS